MTPAKYARATSREPRAAKISAPAKLNFTLEVLGVRSDGYHAIRSVVVPISLADEISVEDADETTVSVHGPCATPELAALDPEKNLAVKAVRLLQRECGTRREVAISIEKNVPSGGGLGGGSADAAATLLALNDKWRLGVPRAELAAMSAAVGSDVPALTLGGCVLMEGRGEIVSPFPAPPPMGIALFLQPDVFVSTPQVYARCRSRLTNGTSILDTMRSAFLSGDAASVAAALQNDLLAPAAALRPEVTRAMARLREAGCLGVSMSGSGPSVFGIVPPGSQVPGCVMVSTAAFDAA